MWRIIFLLAFGLVFTSGLARAAPSFDCQKAAKADERAICADPQLAANDDLTTKAFGEAKAKNRTKALAAARSFLRIRFACGSNRSCIADAQMQAMLDFSLLGASLPKASTRASTASSSSSSEQAPVPRSTVPPTCSVPTSFTVRGLNTAAGGLMNMRSGPGKDFPAIGQMREGDAIVGCPASNGWVNFLTPSGASAWVSPRYLVASSDLPRGVPPVVSPPVRTSIVPAQGDNAFQEDGLFIRVYSDGSGSVSTSSSLLEDNWSISCGVDAMSDKRNCSVHHQLGGPFIHFGEASEPQTVCVFGHDFPGRTGMMRVDRQPPLETNDSGCLPAERILPEMLPAGSITMRWYKWPYDYSRDTTTQLIGLAKSLEIVRRIKASDQ